MPRALALILTTAAVLWTALIVATPMAVAHAQGGPTLAASAIYVSASHFCHQLPDRSFSLSGVQLPVCARCAALYVSAALGALLAWLPRRRRERPADRLVLLACALPTALTWGLEHAAGVPFSNLVRALAAVPLGLAVGWICVRLLRDEPAPNLVRYHDEVYADQIDSRDRAG